ncbi:alpha-hydroxy-acid oxidizing protein [Dethiosulfatarculus sandiegensis]|uniref:FMN-dependent dehydrogenase n=1 Tax=Dethiosulfatarculus sandiegensis TaxID=1429043 RepID=A0A0D2HSG5_9BACT|nr:alpha-hydroxy-acid oxidizing protein [Dethiosulfatarculus sandiegensis]KIX13458.1 FMN-dependent dehydrogenase [Dethiosulfatarculus sandiegensis]
MKEIRAKAKELLKGKCKVCPVCDGRACAGEVPGMGGLGTGSAFKSNVEALARLKFNMRVMHQVTDPVTEADFFGISLKLPILAAPIGGVSFNMTKEVSEQEYISSVIGGCLDQGILGCCGDGAPPELLDAGLAALKENKGQGVPFIKPWEDEELLAKLEKAENAGAKVAGVDLDAAGLITLRLMGKPVSPRSLEQLSRIIRKTSLKFIVKGIMTPEEAKMSLEAGAAGIVVSNHGGRVLDFTPGTSEVLPDIASEVKGKIMILADGGVRTGPDVLKMLALGADFVMLGRPFVIAALGGGRKGVATYIEQLKGELMQAMVLTGVPDVKKVAKSIFYNA